MCKISINIPNKEDRLLKLKSILAACGLAFECNVNTGLITVDEKPGQKVAEAVSELKNNGFIVNIQKPND